MKKNSTKKARIFIHTVGCRANQSDSALLWSHLKGDFVELLDKNQEHLADYAVVNTCCVTAAAQRDCRKTVARILKSNSRVKVFLTGCSVSANEYSTEDLDSRTILLGGGATAPYDLARKISSIINDKEITSDLSMLQDEKYFMASIPSSYWFEGQNERSRPFLKIQNGCSHNCAYCIVPTARGPEQSMVAEQVLSALTEFKKRGVLEVVLTGVCVGSWGVDLPDRPTFCSLLKKAAKVFYPGRIRLSSIEPWHMSTELIDLVASTPAICPHFHIPLQSGDNEVLKDMGRGYDIKAYLDIVKTIKNSIPHACIGTDVICGFPTETTEAFDNTLEFLKLVEPAYVHVFSYSSRKGTMAEKLYGEGNRAQSKKRVSKLKEKTAHFQKRFVENCLERECGVFVMQAGVGITDNFIQVDIRDVEPGSLVRCVLKKGETPEKPLAVPLIQERVV